MAEPTRNELLISEFRANQGVVSEEGRPPRPLLLLTTKGRRSGASHTTPLVYLADGARFIVFGTHGGSPEDPDWFRNLVVAGSATVEVLDETFTARAVVITGDERDRLYATQVERFPQFADYEKKVARVIPVVALEKVASA